MYNSEILLKVRDFGRQVRLGQVLLIIGETEFSDLSQVSIFSLPRFDPEREMRTLQNLWSKRNSNTESLCPVMLRSESPQDISGQSSDSSFEKSFFESDSDSDDEDVNSKRLVYFLSLTSGNHGRLLVEMVVVRFRRYDGH
jgi:hypothetical protein